MRKLNSLKFVTILFILVITLSSLPNFLFTSHIGNTTEDSLTDFNYVQNDSSITTQDVVSWFLTIGNSSVEEANDICNYGGDLYIVGEYPPFIACLDVSGNVKWYNTIASGISWVRSIYVYNDKIYVTGDTAGGHIFVSRLNIDGSPDWIKTVGVSGDGFDSAYDILIYDESIYITGQSEPLVSDYNYYAFIARLSLDGTLQWFKTIEGESPSFPRYIIDAVASEGKLYITGGTDDIKIFIACLGLDGSVQWYKTFEKLGGRPQYIQGIDVYNGKIYITGEISGLGTGDEDIIIACLGLDGTLQWLKEIEGLDNARDIVIENNGIYITGDTNSFGAGGYDTFIVYLSLEGNLQWFRTIGSYMTYGGSESANGIELYDGNIYITGYVDWRSLYYNPPGRGNDVLISKLSLDYISVEDPEDMSWNETINGDWELYPGAPWDEWPLLSVKPDTPSIYPQSISLQDYSVTVETQTPTVLDYATSISSNIIEHYYANAIIGVYSITDHGVVINDPGYYSLANDLTDCPVGKGIIINASNVILDGRGYSIDGVEDLLTYGIYVSSPEENNFTDIIIKNLIIEDWDYGTYLEGVEESLIIDSTITDNINYGIYLNKSSGNSISGNNIYSNNLEGIYLYKSNNNTISSNDIKENVDGIAFYSSNDNLIYDNFFNNTNNAYLATSVFNNWSTSKQTGTNIVGGSTIGGNFWSNPLGDGFSETCSDNDGDGISDSSYQIDVNNIDQFPCVIDRTSPTVEITSPLNQATVSGIANIYVDVFDAGSSIFMVFFYVDEELVGANDTDPFVWEWDTTKHSEGDHVIKAVAHDSLQNVGKSENVTVIIKDLTPPTASFYKLPKMERYRKEAGTNEIVVQPNGSRFNFANHHKIYDPLLVNASDISGILKVEYYVNETLRYTATTPESSSDGLLMETFNWDVTDLDFVDGYYEFKASIYDKSENNNQKDITLNIFIDNTPPSGEFSLPLEGDTVYGTQLIKVSASDNYAVRNIMLPLLGVNYIYMEYDPQQGWIYWWDTTKVEDGTHTLYASIYDFAGLSSSLISINVEIANAKVPIIDIISPLHDSFVNDTLTIATEVLNTDTSKHEFKIEFYIDDILQTTISSSPFSWTWDTTTFSDGKHTIKTVVYDGRPESSSDTLTVTVDNTLPEIFIIEPLTGDVLTDLIRILANVTDENRIESVEFYLNDILIDVDKNGTDGWFTILDTTQHISGPYSISIQAKDNGGNKNTATINVDIDQPNISIVEVNPGGSYYFYTFEKNIANISVKLQNTGSVVGDALLFIDDLPKEVGKVFKRVTIPAQGTLTTYVTFPVSDWDWIDGWTIKGFEEGKYAYPYTVKVTNLFGTKVYDIKSYDDSTGNRLPIISGPAFEATFVIDFESDMNGTVEVTEYILLNLSIKNVGDQDANQIVFRSKNNEKLLSEGFSQYNSLHFVCPELKEGNSWTKSHMDGYTISKYRVAKIFEWKAETTGVARLNLYITYQRYGKTYKTVLVNPITFPIYSNEKTIATPKVKENGDLEITIFGIEGDNVSAKIVNKGQVYWKYGINEEPKSGLAGLMNFIPGSGKIDKTIQTGGLTSSYRFTVNYQYSIFLNTLEGLLIAIEPLLISPLDKIPLFMDILLFAAYHNLDRDKVDQEGAAYIIEMMITDSVFQRNLRSAVLNKLTEKYGKSQAAQVVASMTSDWFSGISDLTVSFFKISIWAWNNIKAPTGGSLEMTVVDPPQEYIVDGKIIPIPLLFGGETQETSLEGEGNITLSLDESGIGIYQATFDITTEYTILNKQDFTDISAYTLSITGTRDESLEGTVTIRVFSNPISSLNLTKELLSANGITESLLESFFIKMSSFNSNFVGGCIELVGSGQLQSSIYDDEININLTITEMSILAEFYLKGKYARLAENGVKLDAGFSPRFNIPLNNTYLIINTPLSNEEIYFSSEPDLQTQFQQWKSTPHQIILYSLTPYLTKTINLQGNNFQVDIESNSLISNFEFDESNKKISLNVENLEGVEGFFNITIPKEVLSGEFKIYLDGDQISPTVKDYETYSIIYFEYVHSIHEIEVIGAKTIQPTQTTIPDFLLYVIPVIAVVLIIIMITKRKPKKEPSRDRLDSYFDKVGKRLVY